MKTLGAAVIAIWACMACASAAHAASGDYGLKREIDLGPPGRWDYATFDPAAKRLYVAQRDKVSVIDPASGAVVGAVAPIEGAHGVAIASGLHKGYATSGADGLVKVFDLGDLRILRTIEVGKDADGIIYDPTSRTVIVMIGDGRSVAFIDAESDTLIRTVALPGEPEFGAVDGKGQFYVNLVSMGAMAKLDIAGGRILAVWPLTGCQRPHGLAFDQSVSRLFSGCANKTMIVVDPDTGRNVASLPIGAGNDAVGVDPARGLVFSPNGEGTLSVIGVSRGDHYAVLATLPTFAGARSMAVDPVSGALFLTHGSRAAAAPVQPAGATKPAWDGARVAVYVPIDRKEPGR